MLKNRRIDRVYKKFTKAGFTYNGNDTYRIVINGVAYLIYTRDDDPGRFVKRTDQDEGLAQFTADQSPADIKRVLEAGVK